MLIEAHLTVAYPEHAEPSLRGWVAARPHLGLRLHTIELQAVPCPRQTMLTATIEGETAQAHEEVRSVREALRPMGIDVRRTKLEAPHALVRVPALYLEHHVKVLVANGELDSLAALAKESGAHLSRTARPARSAEDRGSDERFLTQRFAADAVDAAQSALVGLLGALTIRGTPVIKIERERVIHDDNRLLDSSGRTEALG